ncbi:MAG: DsbA family protein [Gammaproteobacteria bacterium]|nr:DsbA family protein [Gammaproteobacteria bacterium]
MNIFRIAAVSLLMSVAFCSISVSAAEKEEAFGFLDITPAQPTSSGGKIEVVEMFWYGCPHCYNFEPHIKQWKKSLPKDVSFIRVPAIFNDKWALHARAYYTAEALGVLEKIHQPLFDAMHKKNQRLDNQGKLAEFFSKHGISKDKFNSTFHSFAVNSKVNWAKHLTTAYKIDGVPTMIVQGKYRTSASLAGGHKEVIEVVNDLVAKER